MSVLGVTLLLWLPLYSILTSTLWPLSAASAPVSSSVSRRRAPSSVTPLSWERHNIAAMSSITIDPELKPGEFVIKSLFAEFAVLAEKKIEMVMAEPLVSPQGGECWCQATQEMKFNTQHVMWHTLLRHPPSFATNCHPFSCFRFNWEMWGNWLERQTAWLHDIDMTWSQNTCVDKDL